MINLYRIKDDITAYNHFTTCPFCMEQFSESNQGYVIKIKNGREENIMPICNNCLEKLIFDKQLLDIIDKNER